MRNYVIRSLLSGILLLFFMSIVIFVLVRIIPGDPALGILAAKASAERGIDPVKHAELREQMGLNEPMIKQYGLWISDTVTGDLGNSVAFRNRPVLDVVKDKFAVTLQITIVGLLMILVIAVILGTTAAIHQGSMLDSVVRSDSSEWHSDTQLPSGYADRVFLSEILQLVLPGGELRPVGRPMASLPADDLAGTGTGVLLQRIAHAHGAEHHAGGAAGGLHTDG